MGRPRGVDDAVILRAAAEVIGRSGPAGLTLAAVAQEVGVVPGTLAQRFGSKRGLLRALAERSAQEAQSLHERVGAGHESALEALAAFAEESAVPLATPERYANHLAFLCLDLTDPELRTYALAMHRAQRRAVRKLLADAVDAGELRAGTDIVTLAGTLQAVLAGAGLTWALHRRGTLAENLRREIGAVLAPHVPAHLPSERTEDT